MNSIICKMGGMCCTVLLIATAQTNTLANLVQNGDFATGNLSDWTVFLTSNGSLGAGLPKVVPFDVTGTGTASDAAKFQAGVAKLVLPIDLTSQGGGIYQTFNCSAGSYLVSADVAADDVSATANNSAGLFTLLLDGSPVASIDLGHISSDQILRGDLEATVPLSQGSHQLEVEITRPFLSGSSPGVIEAQTPFQFVDNIQVTAVPEQTSLGLLSLGALFVCWSMRSLRK
jgi:hypothetical protein